MDQQRDLFNQLTETPPVPKNEDDWRLLSFNVTETFSPYQPIDDQSLFAGRTDLIIRLIDTVFQNGRHAILYGERGVGKTSLANIIRDQIFHKSRMVKIVKRSCTRNHDFRLIWVHALDDYTIEGKTSSEFLGNDPNPYDIHKTIDFLPKTDRQIFIFDEFDRITNKDTFQIMADTIKYLADYGSRATIVIVGVADSVSDLFGGHPSVQRNIQQIRMPRMTEDELKSILFKRLPILGLEMSTLVEDLIIELSQGLPMYTHLMGQNAALCAVRRQSMRIEINDFNESIEICIKEADETVKEGYLKAVRSSRPTNKYKEALLACALTKTNEKGYFSAADIREPYSRIMGRDLDIPDFARQLKAFCKGDRGPALIQEGTPRSYEYRFVDPLVRPYAIIRGIADKMIETRI